MKFFIFSNQLGIARDPVYQEIVKLIAEIGAVQTFNYEEADISIILGGDGTVLGAARAGIKSPMMIVNTGHLGFLTSTKEQFREAIIAVHQGKYTTTERHMLDVSTVSDPDTMFNALNDVVIKSSSHSKLIRLGVYVVDSDRGEQLISEYRADGLIVATPTGSTAYNLSAGGPIIHPSCPSFVITPICPQGLTFRPIVLPSSFSLRIKPMELGLFMSIDGQIERALDMTAICVNYNSAKIATVNPEGSYFQVLREKMAWGIRPV